MVVNVSGPLPWIGATVDRALALGRAHAVLLHGAAGDGLFECAQAIVQAWLCETSGSVRACGRCASCRQAGDASHPDLLRLLPQELRLELGLPSGADAEASDDGDGGAKSRRKPSRQIRIDEVRAAIDWIATTSSRGRGKVALIHPAETMNLQAASALLKTLEEPPQSARLLLTVADPDSLLATVRSRCQLVRLERPAGQQARDWLGGHGIADAEVLLAACSGRPLDAVAMAAAGIDAARWVALPRAVLAGQAGSLAGWGPGQLLDALHKLCHDGLALASGAPPRFFPPGSVPPPASAAALAAWSKQLAQLAASIDHPWNAGLLSDALLAQARSAWAPAAGSSDTLPA